MVQLPFKKNPTAFFRLPGNPARVGDQASFLNQVAAATRVENVVYTPTDLESPRKPERFIIRDKTFINVSMSSTIVSRFEFRNCRFEDSLFQATVFSQCRFDSCAFVRCNTNRIEFVGTYINPASFYGSLDRFYHANLGKYLYQQLLANSKREFQPEFESIARYQFGIWAIITLT